MTITICDFVNLADGIEHRVHAAVLRIGDFDHSVHIIVDFSECEHFRTGWRGTRRGSCELVSVFVISECGFMTIRINHFCQPAGGVVFKGEVTAVSLRHAFQITACVICIGNDISFRILLGL